MLEPRVGNDGLGRLELQSPYVDGSSYQPWVAVQVCSSRKVGVVSAVDTWGIGTQVVIACRNEDWIDRDVSIRADEIRNPEVVRGVSEKAIVVNVHSGKHVHAAATVTDDVVGYDRHWTAAINDPREGLRPSTS